jgi:glycosyltransferase involved in cell wall biosynthesis
VKPRILILENSLYTTGGFKAILATTEALKTAFDFVYVIDTRSQNKPYLESLGYRVYQLPYLELSKSPGVLLRYLPRLWANTRRLQQIIRTEQAAIVHVNDLFNLLGCALKLRSPKIRLVYHVRLLRNSYIRALYPVFAKLVTRYADRIIAVSKAASRDLNRPDKTAVIYDAPVLTEQAPSWNGLQQPQQARIFYLGNYMSGKGQNLGLEAFIQLYQTVPEASLHFAGSTHGDAAQAFKGSLQQRAQEAGVAGQVYFEEAVTDIETAMKSYDMVLNMSESESFSFVCLEALAYGVPLVTANSGGPAEITAEGRMASLVPNRDTAAAAAALLSIIRNPDEAILRAAEGQQWVRRTFVPATSAHTLRELYQGLL